MRTGIEREKMMKKVERPIYGDNEGWRERERDRDRERERERERDRYTETKRDWERWRENL